MQQGENSIGVTCRLIICARERERKNFQQNTGNLSTELQPSKALFQRFREVEKGANLCLKVIKIFFFSKNKNTNFIGT